MDDVTADTLGDIEIEDRPTSTTIYRIRLSYDKLKSIDDGGSLSLKIPATDENGEIIKDDEGNVVYEEELSEDDFVVMTSDNPNAYKFAEGEENEIHFIEDTGEIIMGPGLYNEWRDKNFEITYEKESFEKNELRPEHYFTCTATDLTLDEDEREEKAIHYTVEDQQIAYEINFNQRLAINVQAKDAYRHSLGRAIDDIVKAISDVEAVKEKLNKVNKMLEDTYLDDEQISKLKEIKGVLESELDLKDSLMRDSYGRGLTAMQMEENLVNSATSDIGTRYSRIELTEDRLSTQQVEFTDLLSQNEDADLVDTVVNYNAMQTVYNASLQAAGKVVKNTLLDFL